MDFLKDDIKPIYRKYLFTAFGSTIVTSIYSVVDMAMVGQYQGPSGTAALAVVAPLWNIIFSLGLLMGIGGSVIFSTKRGMGANGDENQYFTVSIIGSAFLSVLAWILIVFFDEPVLKFFGANDALMGLAKSYILPIKFIFPCFLFTQTLSAFVRNDKNPGLASASVLAGGIFNVFGDYFCVFTLDMGVFGAGLATAIGTVISTVILLTHFFSKKNTLRLVKPVDFLDKLKQISITGFSTFFIDVAMGILTVLFNRQIMKYLDANALSIYGPIINISTIVQCLSYSIGQAAQPIISVNYGAANDGRIRETLKYSIETTAIMGIVATALIMALPLQLIRIFMTPTPQILEMAPSVIRRYALSFLLLPFNVFSTFYFQAILRPKYSMTVSVARGLVISGILILVLPAIFDANSIWFTMPLTELLVFVYAATMVRKCTSKEELTRVSA